MAEAAVQVYSYIQTLGWRRCDRSQRTSSPAAQQRHCHRKTAVGQDDSICKQQVASRTVEMHTVELHGLSDVAMSCAQVERRLLKIHTQAAC